MSDIPKKRIGEILIELGIIDEYRLNHAIEEAQKTGSKIGEIMLKLGYLKEEQLLDTLNCLLEIPIINMRTDIVKKEVQLMLSENIMREKYVVPLSIDGKNIKIAFADPMDFVTIENIKFMLDRNINVVMATKPQIEDTLDALKLKGFGAEDLTLSNVKRSIGFVYVNEINLSNILGLLNDQDNSELHLSIGASPAVRIGGQFTRTQLPIITPDALNKIVRDLLPEDLLVDLKKKKEIEYTYQKAGLGRFRFNIYHQKDGELALTARKLIEKIPDYTELGLPEVLIKLLDKTGLMIIACPGEHDKDTTIASIIDYINTNNCCNIITFEEPIEFIHNHKKSNVNQREVGRDTSSDLFANFENIFKHDPDIIVFSNIINSKLMETAIRATQKGILIIAGINAIDVFSAIDQILSRLNDDYIKSLFAHSLLGVFAQRTIGSQFQKNRVLLWELLLGKTRVQKFIKDNKIGFIKGQASSLQGEYFPIEDSIAQAIKAGKLDRKSIENDPFISKEMLNSFLER